MTLLTLPSAAGTQQDVVARLRSVLPSGWFADNTPILDGVLNGLASAWTGVFGLLAYTQAQARLASCGDVFLDLAAQDFFAGGLGRMAGEPDSSLRARIHRELLRERATRPGLAAALTDLTGRAPFIFEPARLADTGAYGVGSTLAYNTTGGWGSFALPFQCFVRVYRPIGAGVSRCAGFGSGAGGYRVGAIQYATPTLAASTIRDSDITKVVVATMPVATTAWMAISD